MMWKSFVLASSHHTPNKVSALVTTPASTTNRNPRCAPDCAVASVVAMGELSPFSAARSNVAAGGAAQPQRATHGDGREPRALRDLGGRGPPACLGRERARRREHGLELLGPRGRAGALEVDAGRLERADELFNVGEGHGLVQELLAELVERQTLGVRRRQRVEDGL